MTQGIVCVFAKAPEPGQVKTRLATVLGAAAAAELARAFLVDTWDKVAALSNAEPVLALSGDAPLPVLVPDPTIWPQSDGDLGARMSAAIGRGLAAGAPWVIAVGTDSPGLPAALLERAAELLDQGAPSVIGPSEDGGFYLLGLRTLPEGLLADIPWSAPETCSRTIERLTEHDLSPKVLESWFDVDEPADLARLRRGLQAGKIAAPATQRAVRSLGR